MRNFILVISLLSVAFLTGCSKEKSCDTVIDSAPASEVVALEQFIVNNKIDAQRDSRGFYYKIQTTGTGDHPTTCSKVNVNYKGTLTNGTVFDQANDVEFNLRGLIKGWRAGIPLIAQGGKITLYLPPSMGYGTEGTGGIPGNAILIFSIDLVKVY
jgi:FKBP-type peptidyl-prolyl cis-trans isomerase FkpA